jgi:hypothetical protein
VIDNSPEEYFDEAIASRLVGHSLLIGITEEDQAGALIRRNQVFGVVTCAERGRGICVKREKDGSDFWLPPDTRSIEAAEPGDYRNRTTGEIVTNPDYTASWTITRPPSER